MASIGHVAIGLAAARAYDRRVPRPLSMVLWSALSLLPDIDVIGFTLGVKYADPWGHRGATHSLLFSVVVGMTLAFVARGFKHSAKRAAVFATAVLVSHPLLDTMTDGGLGCALFWPFDLTRYFAPWRPIPVAPIGIDFWSLEGAAVAVAELALFCPAFVFALRTRQRLTRPVGMFLAIWLAGVLLLFYRDSSRNAFIGFLLREDTAYTSEFSESAFRAVKAGQSEREVRSVLGRPYRAFWFYTPQDSLPPDEQAAPPADRCSIVTFEADTVAMMRGVEPCRTLGIGIGMSAADVDRQLGPPARWCWQYSWSPGGVHHRERLVCFAGTTVETVIRKWSPP